MLNEFAPSLEHLKTFIDEYLSSVEDNFTAADLTPEERAALADVMMERTLLDTLPNDLLEDLE